MRLAVEVMMLARKVIQDREQGIELTSVFYAHSLRDSGSLWKPRLAALIS